MKSVGRKIFFFSVGIVCLSLLSLGIVSGFMNYQSTLQSVQNDMSEMAEIASDYVEWELKAYLNIAEDLGENAVLSSDDSTVEEKLDVINSRMKKHGFVNGNYAELDGNSPDGNNYSDREYFKLAMQGKSCITSPTISKLTGELVMIFAAPIQSGSEIKGVVFLVPDAEFLNDIMRNINISEGSEGYMLDSSGNTIAAIDVEDVINSRTAKEMAAKDSGYLDLAKAHDKMCAGEVGFGECNIAGTRYFMSYAPIHDTDGWSLAVRAPARDFMTYTYKALLLEIIFILVFGAICGIFSARLGKKIGKSVRFCTERMQKLAQGDLKSPVPEVHSKDETGALAEATSIVVKSLNDIIGDIGRVLGAMANKNFNVQVEETQHFYVGDYADIFKYIRNINYQLNATLSQISTASDQVFAGADQVAAAAQSLSQGATQQASSMEEVSAAVHTISSQVADSSQNCGEVKNTIYETAKLLTTTVEKMNEMKQAMTLINDTSNQISGIIKMIEDIAFQTNILALNASVEAARAGAAGKGFAVVAGEVRSLASKSAQAASDTAELIEKSIHAVKSGVEITSDTANAVSEVNQLSEQIVELIDKIASASQEQASMIGQITENIDQVSDVVQTNSATAEESAAASEQLSGQAEMLKEEVSKFSLHKNR